MNPTVHSVYSEFPYNVTNGTLSMYFTVACNVDSKLVRMWCHPVEYIVNRVWIFHKYNVSILCRMNLTIKNRFAHYS
jgi:hypothetical protein